MPGRAGPPRAWQLVFWPEASQFGCRGQRHKKYRRTKIGKLAAKVDGLNRSGHGNPRRFSCLLKALLYEERRSHTEKYINFIKKRLDLADALPPTARLH